MTNNLYLVFSEKPDHIGVEDYHRWYALHAQENIESPRFVSAQRYSIQEIVNSRPVGVPQHLALYEYEGDMAEWRTDLTRRIETGAVVLPPWFKEIKFRSWDCTPVGGLLRPQSR
jgi:hypothetical protein